MFKIFCITPRLEADLQRPELIIEPRADLAASLGVTTSSLSQAIRIATIGEIDQNAARFSLSDRQIPIRVMLPENSRDRISTIRNLPVRVIAALARAEGGHSTLTMAVYQARLKPVGAKVSGISFPAFFPRTGADFKMGLS